MGHPLSYATVRHNGEQHDLSVPRGTTVAGLLAMLEIDASSSEHRITLADGRPVPLSAAIGRDLPSGIMFSITGTEASRQAQREAQRRTQHPWFIQALTRSSVALFLIALHFLAVALPLLGLIPTPTLAYRIVIAIVSGLVLTSVITLPTRRHAPTELLFVNLLAGSTLLALLPDTPHARTLAPMFFMVGAFLTALILWLRSRSHTAATFIILWTAALLTTALALYTAIPFTSIAPLGAALAVWGIATTSSFSVRVPDTQLIDLPLVRTVAPSVRAPHIPSPARITTARITRTIHEGQEISSSLITAWTGLALLSLPSVTRMALQPDMRGWASLALLTLVTISLALLPRLTSARIGHLLPRIPAICGVIALTIVVSSRWNINVAGAALALICIAVTIVSTALALHNRPHSAFIGRSADLLQTLSLFGVLPASVIASGLFDLIRQVAS